MIGGANVVSSQCITVQCTTVLYCVGILCCVVVADVLGFFTMYTL